MVSNSPFGIGGPKGMDPKVVKILHDAFKKTLEDPRMLEVLDRYHQPVKLQNHARPLRRGECGHIGAVGHCRRAQGLVRLKVGEVFDVLHRQATHCPNVVLLLERGRERRLVEELGFQPPRGVTDPLIDPELVAVAKDDAIDDHQVGC